MILIKNLTKVYKSKAKTICKALDNINITLPDRGFVFILGKSGSGKSTLLNLLGVFPSLIAMDAALMILIAFLSSLIPTLLLKHIKPVEIIKAKE